MLRLLSTIRKELILLRRDKGGLAILFLMPLALIIIMALIQDAPFRDYQEFRIPVAVVNNDTGSFGRSITQGLSESGIFAVHKKSFSGDSLRTVVKSGDYKVGVLIPANATELLNRKVDFFVAGRLAAAGLSDSSAAPKPVADSLKLTLIFAPDIKKSFRSSVISSLRQAETTQETGLMIAAFYRAMNSGTSNNLQSSSQQSFAGLEEISTQENPEAAVKMNSVQHNVPAWTIFGMFFIVISLSGSIIREREDGSYTRVLTMPGSYSTVLAGKITAYLVICLIQCALMLMVGLFLLPHLGLPRLVIGNSIGAIAAVAFSCGLAATGYGVFVGTLFRTHQQSSTFGAVSVVILAALGGIWVPVYVMPEALRILANMSPLYWGLSGFHRIFLSGGHFLDVAPYCHKLIIFFILMVFASMAINRAKQR